MASGLYATPLKNNLTQTTNFAIDFDDTTAGAFKCMLVDSSYTPNFDTDSVKTDVSGEIVGAGYAAGGEALTSVTFTISGGTITWDAGDVTWTASTITNAQGAVVYDTTEPNEPLIAYVDFGGSFSTTSGTFQIVWNASGIFTLDVTP